ncbi:MAG TPA: sel1 repeat family protein [Gammaproteobacteria bacterium]|nr:sel1 repeat family protein [Gammaproteobacteria bacterium]
MIGFSRFMLCIGFCMSSILAYADDNSLIIPAAQQCTLERIASEPKVALDECLNLAQLGYADAQFVLGEYWYQGQLTPRDYLQALKWFEQASVQGHAIAQLRLGTMFYRGEGVSVNSIQAYIVLKMSAINGSDEALDTADRVAAQMQRNELEVANQVLAQIFRSYMLELSSDTFTQ